MDIVKYIIWNHGAYCRISCNDVRNKFRALTDGGCILDLMTIIDCIKAISEGCKNLNAVATFEVINKED